MRILVTNDDGIYAAQLPALVRWCQKLGEVTLVAPKVEQSAKSHGITLRQAFEAKQVDLVPGVECWCVDSTPADCVRFAVLGLHKQFDLVISGINRGLNIGTDVLYSGTAAAIFEAGILGLPGVALSVKPENYDCATQHLDRILDFFRRHGLMETCSHWNVNIPPQGGAIRITHQGGPYYSDDFSHIGNDMYMPTGKLIYQEGQDLSLDTDACMAGCISVSPLTITRTDGTVYSALRNLQE